MELRTVKALLGAVATLVAVAGCSTTVTPGPVTSTSTGNATTFTSGVTGVPHVTTPLNVSKWLTAPCTVLTQAQVNSLAPNAPSKDNSTSGTGPGCSWDDPSDLTKPSLGIGFVTTNKYGLESLYEKHQQGGMDVLNRLSDIDGYPAVIYNVSADLITNGSCNAAVGVSDQLVMSAEIIVSDGPGKATACDTAVKLATLAMNTMTGRS